MPTNIRAKTLEAKLADKIIHRDAGCWDWTGKINAGGYGRLRPESVEIVCDLGYTHMVRQKDQAAHRVVYESLVGPIPQGLVLDHVCGNRACVRPDHLEPVTQAVNVQRSKSDVCPQGHALEGDNLYVHRGKRGCKICRTDAARRHREKVKK